MNVLLIGDGTMGSLVHNYLKNENHTVKMVSNLKEKITDSFDIMIDFSHPDCIQEIIEYSHEFKTPLLIATTGYSDDQLNNIHDLAKVVPVMLSGNYSLGVILMQRLVREAAKVLGADFDIEIIDKHHHHKVDAPSGTAKMLLSAANEGLHYKPVLGRSGFKKREKNEIGVHALRGGTIVGTHEIMFAGHHEILSIKHEALSKEIFVKGALKGAQWLLRQPAGFYSMEDVLFEN